MPTKVRAIAEAESCVARISSFRLWCTRCQLLHTFSILVSKSLLPIEAAAICSRVPKWHNTMTSRGERRGQRKDVERGEKKWRRCKEEGCKRSPVYRSTLPLGPGVPGWPGNPLGPPTQPGKRGRKDELKQSLKLNFMALGYCQGQEYQPWKLAIILRSE